MLSHTYTRQRERRRIGTMPEKSSLKILSELLQCFFSPGKWNYLHLYFLFSHLHSMKFLQRTPTCTHTHTHTISFLFVRKGRKEKEGREGERTETVREEITQMPLSLSASLHPFPYRNVLPFLLYGASLPLPWIILHTLSLKMSLFTR